MFWRQSPLLLWSMCLEQVNGQVCMLHLAMARCMDARAVSAAPSLWLVRGNPGIPSVEMPALFL